MIVGETVAPPTYDPPPIEVPAELHAIPPIPASETAAPQESAPVRELEVTVPVEGTSLGATIYAPDSPGQHPAMIFVHGQGTTTRDDFTEQAVYFARAGIVTMTYDKRTIGYSFRHRDFRLLADDVLAALDVLRSRPDVDPNRAGLWGVSEGSWVTPIAAADPRVGFVVLVSAPNVSPLRQVAWAMDEQLYRLHAPQGVRQFLAKAMAGFDLPFLSFDPVPALERMDQPVLAIYGADDPAMPFVDSTMVLTEALERGGNRDYTIRFIPGANHGLKIEGTDVFMPGYREVLAHWVTGLPDTARPSPGVQIAGESPTQRSAGIDVPLPPWYAAGYSALLALGVVGLGCAAPQTASLLGRVRRRRMPAWLVDETSIGLPVYRRVRRLAWFALAYLLVSVGFIVMTASFAMNQGGSALAIQAGWALVRLMTVGLLVLEVAAVTVAVAAWQGGWRPRALPMALVFAPLASGGALLAAASYFGLFV